MKASWFILDVGAQDFFAPYDVLPNGCLLVGDNGHVLGANQALAAMTEYSVSELKMMDLTHLMQGSGRDMAYLSLAASDGNPILLTVQTAGGKNKVAHAKVGRIDDKNTKLKGYFLTFIEKLDSVSHSEASSGAKNERLPNSESTLRAILSSSMDGICVLDPNFKVLAYNDTAYTEFLKYAGVDLSLSESSIQEQLTESEFTRWKEDVFGRVFKGESFVNIIKREDNRTFRNKYTPVIDDHGELLGGLEVSQDITDYVESRSALQLIEDSLKSVIDHNPAGIARINTEGRITYTSERGAELFGYLPDEMKGNLAIKYIADTDHEVFFSSIKSLLEGEQEIIMDLNVKSKSGIRTFKGITTLVRDDKDDPVEFFLSYMDISSTLENQLKLEDIENKYEKLFSNMQDLSLIHI